MTRQSMGRSFTSVKIVAATLIAGGALVATGCSAMAGSNGQSSAGAALSQAATSVPAGVAVSCAPGQQTLVRQAIVAGQAAVQVECVPGSAGTAAGHVAHQPVFAPSQSAWAPAAAPVATVPVRSTPAVYRPVSDDEIVYQPRTRVVERRSGRSWQKSAVIIGSSAGVGAGVGAAIGGKKGALIGAAVGGGSAAIWDQVTRNR